MTPRLPAVVRLCFLAGPMLSMIDSSVVNVAVPSIVGGLHTSLGTAAWAVSGYLLGLACGLAATPWLARRYGTLPAYGTALGSALAWGGGLALAACYVLRERLAHRHRAPAPVSLSLLRSPARAFTLALACIASVVLFAVLFLAPVFLQQIQHHSTTVTGLVLLPQGIVMGLASWLGSVVIERGKSQPAVITVSVAGGLALLAVSTLGLLLLDQATPLWVTTALLCGRGVALGLTIQPLVMVLLDALPASAMPDANTLFNMAERLSGSFGIALLATLYASRAAATGDLVAALHDCALVLTVAAAVGAVAAACNHGVSASDAGFAQGGRHGRRHHSAAASQRADQAVPAGER